MVIAPDDTLFRHAAARRQEQLVRDSREWRMIEEVARASFKGTPTDPPWRWASENVFLDEKMAATPGFYDPDFTPWTKEIQEAALNPDISLVAFMKPSRSGGSEAGLNILRWMPGNWPGNAGVCFPEDKQGRDVTKRRITESLARSAAAQMSDDPHDNGLSNIYLRNMMIKMGPSGSARLFTEWWVRYFMLDEIEEHDDTDSTTTWERALSRQSDVAHSLLYALSKPKKAGGPIHVLYCRGSQKEWMVPCPRCERRFYYDRSQFHASDDCRHTDGNWNLGLVINDTFCLCPHCQGRIDEKEKRSMNDAAVWTPRATEQRMRLTDGKPVPPTPGWESYHITDYASYHPKVRWGELKAMELSAFEINPTRKAQVHFLNNHCGLPEEPELIGVDAASIARLVAGFREERRITLPDGTTQTEFTVHGHPDGYDLAYRLHVFESRLPFQPAQILFFADKQKSHIKFTVWALTVSPAIPGYVAAHLIDLGRVDDETELETRLMPRDYWIAGSETPMRITSGFIDARHRGQEAYKFCLRMHAKHGLQIWPVRGEGMFEPFKRKRTDVSADEVSRDTARGKMLRFVRDQCELGELMVRYFKDHTAQTELEQKIAMKLGWRLFLPRNYPVEYAAELTAEKYDAHNDQFFHNYNRYGPNDYRDCTKYLVLWLLENLPHILTAHGMQHLTAGNEPK